MLLLILADCYLLLMECVWRGGGEKERKKESLLEGRGRASGARPVRGRKWWNGVSRLKGEGAARVFHSSGTRDYGGSAL